MRIKGAGAIEKRGKNVYRIRFCLGKDRASGRYLYTPWRKVRGTKTDALRALEEYRNELESGIRVDCTEMTFGEYSDIFHEQRIALGSLARTTIKGEEYNLRKLNKYLSDIPMRDIDALTVKRALTSIKNTIDASNDCIKRLYKTTKQLFKAAIFDGVVLHNPCDRIEAPKVQKPNINFLMKDQIGNLICALLEEEKNTDCRNRSDWTRSIYILAHVTAVRLALATGMRRGEIFGLRWGSFDEETSILRITHQMTDEGLKDRTKTGRPRIVMLDSFSVPELMRWKEHQAKYLNYLGIKANRQTPIITDENGNFCNVHNFTRWWREFRDRYGLQDFRFHDLRHTQATQLIAEGKDLKTVQNRLGHTLASTTLDIYASFIPGREYEAAETMGNLLATAFAKASALQSMEIHVN